MLIFKKIILFFLCLVPCALLVYKYIIDDLGAEPIEFMLQTSGIWSLRFLLISLSITSIRLVTDINFSIYRRMLGLFAFFYAILHLAIYVVFEHSFFFEDMLEEIITKKHIFVGFLSFLLFIPLAITSTKGWIIRLKQKWFLLHKTVYLLYLLGILHFFFIVKSDITEPVIYLTIFVNLMLVRKLSNYLLKR